MTVSGTTVTLTLTSTFLVTDAVVINYTGSGVNAIQDISGNDAVAITNLGSGVVADGYVRGAQLWIDTNHDGQADFNTGVTTDANGNFFLPPSTPAGSIIAIGGVNIDTGVPNTMPLSAPERSTVINPLTTLVQAVVASTGVSTADASASVVAALGLTGVTDLTTFDPIQSNNLGAQQAAATIATISIMADTSTTDATVQTTIMNNLVTQVTQATQAATTVDLGDSGVVGSLLNNVTGLDLAAQSSIADASNAVSNATDLLAITQAQSQYLDTIAPGSSTITVTSPTNDTTPSIKVNLDISSTDGKAVVSGDVVELIVDGVKLTQANIDATALANGYIVFGDAQLSALTEGSHTISAKVIDQSGNTGTAYPLQTVVIDTTAPTAPTIGTVATDDVINATEEAGSVTISGTTEAGSTVTVNGHSATVTGTTWSYTLSAPAIAAMGEGTEALSVVSTDAAGNTTTTTKNISIDTITPTNTVTITTITDNVTPTTGAITAGSTTNDNTLDIAGTLSTTLGAGEKLAVYDGSVLVGYATVTGSAWTLTTSSLSNATHSFTAVAIDAAGNVGTPSSAFGLTVNATVPTTTATITQGITVTNDATPTLSGTVSADVANEKVIIYDGVTKLGEATRTGTSWSYDVSSTLSDGTHSFTAVVENAGGNQGAKSSTYALAIDTISPTAPTITKVASDDVINLAEQTAGVTLTGTTEAGSTVTVDGHNATVTGTTWSYTLNTAAIQAMSEGAETLTIVSTDAAGNTATTTKSISVDTLASSIAINAIATNNAINKAEKSSVSGVEVSGTADANATIVLELGAGNIKSITADGNGDWAYTLGDADYKVIGTGATIKATAVDSAGNSAFVTQAITIDTIAPALSPIALATASDTGVVGDRKGNDTTPDFTFTAESDAAISYSLDGTNYSALATGTGSAQTLSIPTLAGGDKDYTVYVKATDGVGNETIRTATYTLDTTVPTAAIALSDTALKLGDTSTVTITFSEAVNGFALGDLSAQNGVLSNLLQDATNPKVYTATFTPTVNMEDTTNVISLVTSYTDIAGNTGTVKDSANYAVDTKAPTATITLDDSALKVGDTSTVTITFSEAVTALELADLSAQNGALSNLTTSDNITYTATFTPTANIEDTTNVISLATTYTDVAGNAGTIASSANYVIDTIAPVAPIVALTTDSGTSNSDKITNVGTVTATPESGGSIQFSSDNTNWQSTQPTASEGANTLHVRQTDAAGNVSETTDFSFTLDTLAPYAMISMSNPSLKIGETSSVMISFIQKVTNFSNDDITVQNGTLGTLTTNDGGTTWTATFTPTADIEDTSNVISLSTAYTDIAGNAGMVATSANYTVDTVSPSITISAISGGFINSSEAGSAVTISGTTTGVEDQQTVSVTVNGQTHTGTVTNNAWSIPLTWAQLGGLSEGTITTATANVSDAAGNTATQATQTFIYDATAPTITSGATASVSENVATTTAVYTAMSTGSNNTYALGGADASKFAIDATTGVVTFVSSPNYEAPTDTGADNVYNITVTATDSAGNASSAQAVAITVENVDVTANTITTDNIINATEKTAGVVITGTNEPSATVTVNGNAATVTGTSWSYTLTPTAIAAMGEGAETLTIVSGGQTVTKNITVDTLIPTIVINTIATDGIINATEKATTGTISGTTTAENGQVVTVKVGSIIHGTATISSGAWSLTGIDLTGLADANYTVTADITDFAGNSATQATKTFSVDTTVAAPIVALVTDAGPSATDKITKIATVSISNVESGATVEYSSDGSTWTTTQPTATEGANTLHVRQTDAAGNVSATSDFTFTYDSTAPAKVDSSKGIFSVSDASHISAMNIDGAVGAKVILASDGTIIGSSSAFSAGTATLNVTEQTALKDAQIRAYDTAGNAITSSSHIYLGTSAGETLTATTSGDAMFGFGGTDTFVLKAANSGVNIIADYTAGEKIDFGNGETLWASANAPTNWSIDASGMATYTGSTTPSDLATQFFTDFAAATGGSVGAVVGLVANGKTYIFGEGATTANTDDLRVRIVDVADTTGLSISNGTVQLLGLGSPVAFDITSLLSSGVTFFEAYPEYLESTTISLQGTSGTYKDYSYDGTNFTTDGTGAIALINNSGTLTITHAGQTETLSFSNAHTVPSMSGIDTTGLNQVTATFTVLSVPTVATTTDWWESGYTYWNGSASVLFPSLEQMVTTVTNPINHYSFSVGSNDLHVMLLDGGTLHIATGSDGNWTDSGTVVTGGTWSNSGGYLTIVVDNVGTTAFKMGDSSIMETEIDAVGSIRTETWYYGPTEAQFQSTLHDVFDTYTPHTNSDPMLTLYNGETLGLVVDENTTVVQTFTATDANNDTLTYSLSGLDASAFNISSTGVLSFKTAPNYESPTDNGSNNVYDVTVVVNDGNGGIDTQAVSVQVKDINEGTPINNFSATSLITAGQANFFTLYEGGKEFEQISLSGGSGSWDDYLYTTPFFTPNESGSFTYVDNGNNTLTITDAGEGGKVSTLALSNAQTAVTSGGVDISAFGFNQVTATFTVTHVSDLATTADWWEANYYSGNEAGVLLTDLATLANHLVTYSDYMNVWINDDVKVILNSDHTLTEMVWDGTYTTWTDANNIQHTTEHLVAGGSISGSWTLDATYLHVNVTGVGEAAFTVQNGTIMKTEIEAVGSTHSETMYYHGTMTAVDVADALGTHNSNITGYQGIVTEDNAHNYDLSFLDTATINLDLSTFDASFNGKLASIDLVDDYSSPDVHNISVADVLRLGVDKTLHLEVDLYDGFDSDTIYAEWIEDQNASSGSTVTFIDPNSSGATIIVHTVI